MNFTSATACRSDSVGGGGGNSSRGGPAQRAPRDSRQFSGLVTLATRPLLRAKNLERRRGFEPRTPSLQLGRSPLAVAAHGTGPRGRPDDSTARRFQPLSQLPKHELSKIWRKAGDSNAYVPRDPGLADQWDANCPTFQVQIHIWFTRKLQT